MANGERSYGLFDADDIRKLLSGSIARDAEGRISSVTKTGGRTITISRNGDGTISGLSDGEKTWTISRDVNDRISSWAVA